LQSGMSTSETNSQQAPNLDVSLCVQTSPHARAKQKIAALMDEIEILKQDKAIKQRKTTYYVSQGRAVHRIVALYTPIEDLITKNDRRCEDCESSSSTMDQDRLQCGYIELAKALPWLHDKLACLDHEESEDMLKKLKRGADSARGDDTGTLKELVASWVNIECHLTTLIRTNNKHHRGFVSDACGRLLCPAEWCWEDPVIRTGICDRTIAYIVSENSWPSFMYENYKADANNLECGLMKSRLLIMGFKAIFTSPSSANEVDGEGNDMCCLHHRYEESNTSRDRIWFALSSINSWRTVDGDFNYQIFWNSIINFFEDALGPAARTRVNKLLEWWTRQVINH
ncbi:hypothetical protein DFJ58DRAFT_673314, partial [Suillus subalutaceus]|uniref:uncharacterized protein n=1 Tax=Suillus subalutaceus TaxID=48586 RepID=UPI001B860E76